MKLNVFSKNEVKIFVTLFIIYIIFVNWPGMREISLFSVTKSIVEYNSLSIDNFYNQTTDRSFYNWHYYSDKEPGISFLASPIYTLWKLLYYNLFPENFINENSGNQEKILLRGVVSDIFVIVNPGFFELISMILVIVFTSSLFLALTAVMIYKFSRFLTKNENERLILTFIYGLGSLAFHYGLIFLGYGLSMFFSFLSFYILYITTKSKKKLYFILAGILSGFAFSLDLLSILVTTFLFLYIFIQKKQKYSSNFIYGVLIGMLPFLIYNLTIFDNPLDFPRNHLDKEIWRSLPGENGIILNIPYNLHVIIELLILPYRGLFIYFPVMFMSIIGLFFMRKEHPLEGTLILFIFISILFVASTWWAWWHGSTFGPKLLVTSVPFIIIPILYTLKNKYLKPFVIFLFLISFMNNLAGLAGSYEDFLQDNLGFMIKDYQKKFDNFQILENPLQNYYYPYFLKCGSKSFIIDSIILSKNIDIRNIGDERCPIPFLSVIFCVILITSLWNRKLTYNSKIR